MDSHITLEPLSSVPDGASVAHYDELDDETQHHFVELVDSSADAVDAETLPGEFEDLDVVKFTSYYSIEGA